MTPAGARSLVSPWRPALLGQQRKGSLSIVLQQIVAVTSAFVQTALIGSMTLPLTHCIPVVGGVGSDRRVED